MKKIELKKALPYLLFLMAGITLGWLFFHSPKANEKPTPATTTTQAAVWTCSMHPQIRKPAPGKCPLCAMDLIPLAQNVKSIDPDAIQLTKDAVELANVQTSIVARQNPVKEIRMYGKVAADERLLQNQVAHFPGRIEKLTVNFTGETVRKGQVLATIYSSELVTAQQELLESAKTKLTQPDLYQAAKEKLLQWKLSNAQIARIEKSGKVQENFEIISNTSGVVTSRRINVGDHLASGTILYDIANLSTVWVLFDVYESDLPFIAKGNLVKFDIQAIPGKTFSGKVLFIDPVVDPNTRISKVRVEIDNRSATLKPEMFATGVLKANLAHYKDKIVIPRSALLWTGKRSLVYVKQPHATDYIFKLREVTLGPVLGNGYTIISGLNEGEEIVTQGTFNIDAAAQLDDKPSMMNKEHLPEDAPLQKAMLVVSGTCDQCKERIEKAAKSVAGVSFANWTVVSKKLELQYNPRQTTLRQIEHSIIQAGHDIGNQKADLKTYEALPACCKYRK